MAETKLNWKLCHEKFAQIKNIKPKFFANGFVEMFDCMYLQRGVAAFPNEWHNVQN